MSYVGSSAAVIPVGFSGVNSQSFNGDGSTVAFTLNRPVSAVNAIEVMVNNVQQSPYDGSYSVSSTTLTFSAAPSSGTANIYVVYRDFPVGSITDTGAVQKTGDTMTGNLIVDANVGIGTTTPDVNLDVTKTSDGIAARFQRSSGGGVVDIETYNGIGGIGTSDNIPFRLNTNNTERVRIDTSGNVGIGTSFPVSTAKTSIKQAAGGGAGSTQLHLEQSNATDGYDLKCDSADGALAFLRYAGGSATERMRIDSAGPVTMPYQPFFQGYINSRLTVATSSSKVASNIGVASNVGGHWANYRFTCPVAGVYEVHSGWMKETSTTLAIHWDVSINGQGANSYRRIRSWEGTGYFYLSNTWLITLSANDYIEFYAYAGGAGQQIYEEHSSIYIRLVG